MRWIVGGQAVMGQAASTSQMGRSRLRFWPKKPTLRRSPICRGRGSTPGACPQPDQCRGARHGQQRQSQRYGKQEGTAYNGHFGCTCYHPLFVFNQFGDLERNTLRAGNVHSADGWRDGAGTCGGALSGKDQAAVLPG
jgi:hypothetical protein